jgi:3-dehydroquinate dehydratase-1
VKEHPNLANEIRAMGISLIVSWHNFIETPEIDFLKTILSDELRFGDVAKIVTMANSFKDNTIMLSLYKYVGKKRLIAFCMGDIGLVSRTLCVFSGSPFTYSALNRAKTAPGQILTKEMKEFYDEIKICS